MTVPDLSDSYLEIHDEQENDDQEVVRVQAAVYNGAGAVVVSDWFEVDQPGVEESKDDALADACGDAEAKLVNKLRDDHGIDEDEAWALVNSAVARSNMPIPR